MKPNDSSRRKFIKQSSALAIAGIGAQLLPSSIFAMNQDMDATEEINTFTLPDLRYAYEALEPYIDKQTMEIHHDKHHAGYVKGLNQAVAENKISGSLDEIIRNVGKYPTAVRNMGGGHWNHSFFWKLMGPGMGGAPTGQLLEAVNGSFGDFAQFQKLFNEAAGKRFGSGWAWMIYNKTSNKLEIGSTANQDNPLMDISDFKGVPIMGIDVWEHAYYLKYQNKRGDYLNAWWNLLNWNQITKNLNDAQL